MRSNITKIVTALVLLSSQVLAYATDALYLNADTGWAQQSGLPSRSQANATSINHDNFATAWHVGLGYNHDLNKQLGIGFETGIAQYGKTTYQQTNGNTQIIYQSISWLITSLYHFQSIDAGIKLGLTRGGAKNTGVNNKKNTKSNIESGLNFAYLLSQHIAIQGSYIHIFGNNSTTLPALTPSVDAILAGFKVTF
jgi:hypothetical protein